jgi:hypothetical protein
LTDTILTIKTITYDIYPAPGQRFYAGRRAANFNTLLKLFGRDANSKSYLSELFLSPPLIEHKNNLIVMDSRYVLQQFPINSELEEIKAKLLEWMDILIRSNQNHAQTHQNNRRL